MNPICKECKYYLEAGGLQFCGLGYNPVTITECDSKEEGQTDYNTAIEPCSQLDYLYPIGKGVEQAPSWIPKPIYYFSRYHETYEDKKTRKVTIVCILDKDYKKVRLDTPYVFKYEQKLYGNKRLFQITWDEPIRESFIASRKKRHRHTIK